MQVAVSEKQKEIESLQEKIEWIKSSISSVKTPLHEIFSSTSPKRDLLLKWGEYLEKLAGFGVYKKPLTSISTTITEELKELGLNSSIEYVRKALPHKYKDASKNTSDSEYLDSGNKNRKTSSKDFEKENKHFIDRLNKTAKLLAVASDKLTQKHLMSLLSPKETEEMLKRWDNSLQQLADVMDGREKVPVSKQAIYLYCASAGSTNYIYTKFVTHIRKFAKFSTKQAMKIIEGRVSKITLLYEPKDRLQAINDGFYGFPCDWCGSWRTVAKKKDKSGILQLYCYACSEASDLQTEQLPET